MNEAVAFIPARKGSKGLPGKNKKLFHGKSLVQWSIEQAKDSKLFDNIIVSSDDLDCLKIAKDCGVEAQHRHSILAEDDTHIDDVLYDYFVREENRCKYVCLLNPTSPLRSVEDIIKSHKYIKMKKYWAVVSVVWNDFIGWIEKPSNKGPMCTYSLDKRPNRQTRNDFFLENGSIYWLNHEVILTTGNLVGNPLKVKLYEMPKERSFEIDDKFDWFLAERIYEYLSMERADSIL